jgi:hypothetical protein
MCGRYRLSRRKQIIEEYVDYIERKNLSDLVRSLMTDRAIFVGWLKKMSAHSHKTAGDHRWTELGEIAVPILPMQSQPCYAGTDRGAGGLGRAFRVHRNSGVGRGDCCFLSVSNSPLPLARIQRIPEMAGRRCSGRFSGSA